MRFNYYLAKGTLVGALGGLLFGFDTAVISGTTQQLSDIFHLSPFKLGLTVSIALFGTVIGAMTSGELGQKIGGREALRIMAALYVISAVGCAFAWNWPVLVAFRFIGGLGIGGSSVLGPVYIAELAPAKWRGRRVGDEAGCGRMALGARSGGSPGSALPDSAVCHSPQFTLAGDAEQDR